MNALTPDRSLAFSPDPANPRQLRDAFAKFATGVTVVTCATDDGPVCITANSFTSISLDPALVMWAPGKGSRRFPRFRAAQHYAIHVLAAEQADLCWACAKDAGALRTMRHRVSELGVPLIPGCLARFECTRVACHEAGDHVIVVGQVDRAEMRDGDALAFFAGRFGQFAQS